MMIDVADPYQVRISLPFGNVLGQHHVYLPIILLPSCVLLGFCVCSIGVPWNTARSRIRSVNNVQYSSFLPDVKKIRSIPSLCLCLCICSDLTNELAYDIPFLQALLTV